MDSERWFVWDDDQWPPRFVALEGSATGVPVTILQHVVCVKMDIEPTFGPLKEGEMFLRSKELVLQGCRTLLALYFCQNRYYLLALRFAETTPKCENFILCNVNEREVIRELLGFRHWANLDLDLENIRRLIEVYSQPFLYMILPMIQRKEIDYAPPSYWYARKIDEDNYHTRVHRGLIGHGYLGAASWSHVLHTVVDHDKENQTSLLFLGPLGHSAVLTSVVLGSALWSRLPLLSCGGRNGRNPSHRR